MRFHGIKTELIGAQARLLGKTLITQGTGPTTFESAFTDLLRQLTELGLSDLVFGNIHLADVRAWYEERTVAHGFRHHEPLGGVARAALLEEFIMLDDHQRLSWAMAAALEWPGREFTPHRRACRRPASTASSGEYHSFSLAGPLFSEAVPVRAAGRFESEGHLILDLDEDS